MDAAARRVTNCGHQLHLIKQKDVWRISRFQSTMQSGACHHANQKGGHYHQRYCCYYDAITAGHTVLGTYQEPYLFFLIVLTKSVLAILLC